MTQNQSLCTVSDIFISEHGQFILSTVVNNKIEKKISLISNLKKNQLDTLDIPFENVSMIESLQIVEIHDFLFLPVITQSIDDQHGFYELTCLKFSKKENKIQFLSKTKMIENLKGKISSFTTQKVGDYLQINFCFSEDNSWTNTAIVFDAGLSIIDEYHRSIIGEFKSLKILNDENLSFFITNNFVFNLTADIRKDPKWNFSNNILASKIHDGHLILIVSNQSSTSALLISKECRIIKERILVFSESFRGNITQNIESFDIILNFVPISQEVFPGIQIEIEPKTLQVIQETLINSEEYLPFFKFRLLSEDIEYLIYDEVFKKNNNDIGVKILKKSNNTNIDTNYYKDKTSLSSFFLFPNPAKNLIQISLSKNDNLHQIVIYNSRGVEMINAKTTEKNYYVDVSAWRQGLYKVEVTNDGKATYKSLVVGR